VLLFNRVPASDRILEPSRLLKNKFREGQTPNILYASLLDYTFGSASLVASARFSAACQVHQAIVF
jgi:hypothetical protein